MEKKNVWWKYSNRHIYYSYNFRDLKTRHVIIKICCRWLPKNISEGPEKKKKRNDYPPKLLVDWWHFVVVVIVLNFDKTIMWMTGIKIVYLKDKKNSTFFCGKSQSTSSKWYIKKKWFAIDLIELTCSGSFMQKCTMNKCFFFFGLLFI